MNKFKSYSVYEATRVLAGYCAYQERCHKEVESKLKEMNMIPEAREKIILYLLENNFLNEERFANAFARGKFTIKKWGKIKITNELKFRNISPRNIATAMQEIDEGSYRQTAKDLAEKKWSILSDTNEFKRKVKLINHLIYKGFERNLAYTIVNEIMAN